MQWYDDDHQWNYSNTNFRLTLNCDRNIIGEMGAKVTAIPNLIYYASVTYELCELWAKYKQIYTYRRPDFYSGQLLLVCFICFERNGHLKYKCILKKVG